jgi:hypothetical protein
MLPFFDDDGFDGLNCSFVFPTQLIELLLKMPKDHPLNSHGGRADSPMTERSCNQAEHEAANATNPIASATRTVAALKLSPEYGTVPLFVRLELD